ncbi:MAG: hypothetical protein Q7O66_05110 [Dehalococcoidia bacterium]|nr:hypothetical protein [Dehalococcoidia bacterium]
MSYNPASPRIRAVDIDRTRLDNTKLLANRSGQTHQAPANNTADNASY